MVTTSRRFALIVRSRAAASRSRIRRASSISWSGDKRGIRPISSKYLFSTALLSFMPVTVVAGANPPLLGKCVIFKQCPRGALRSLFGETQFRLPRQLPTQRPKQCCYEHCDQNQPTSDGRPHFPSRGSLIAVWI